MDSIPDQLKIWHKHYKENTHKCWINHELVVSIKKSDLKLFTEEAFFTY